MKCKHTAWIVLGVCAGVVGACSDDTEIDSSTAQAAMRALVSSVDTAVTGYESDGDSAGTVKLTCSGGGAAEAQGHVSVAVNPVAVDVELAIAYDACQTQGGTTLDGNLVFKQTVLAGQAPLRVETVYQGDVRFTGEVEAECGVDVKVLVDEAGKAVSVSGTFCGNDAAALNVQVTPRWKG
jgi:hypothetical protein